MKSKIVAALLTFVALSFFATSQLAAAVKYGYWPPASYIYDYHTLDSAWQSAVSYGSSQWNISGSTFEWAPGTTGDKEIFKGTLDGYKGAYAVTTANLTDNNGTITSTGQLTWVNIKFDTAESWFTGSGTPTALQVDLRSVAAHEFGHALGLAHTQILCPSNSSSNPTMCPYYSYGQTYARSLTQDDKNGVLSIYPAPSLQSRSIKTTGNGRIMVHFEYEDLNTEESIKAATHVVHGIITDVSSTQWNQDSGEYWEDLSSDETTRFTALPYFRVTLSEASDLVEDRSPLARDLTITVLGFSPLDIEDGSDLQVGSELIALVRHTNLVWRTGKRPIVEFVGDPAQSHFYKEQDGRFYRESDRNHKEKGLELEAVQDLARRIHFAPEK